MPTEGSWFPVLGTYTVDNLEIKLRQFFGLMNLSLIQNFEGGKVFQILMVRENQN
jgi:hypothetical protein